MASLPRASTTPASLPLGSMALRRNRGEQKYSDNLSEVTVNRYYWTVMVRTGSLYIFPKINLKFNLP